MTRPAEDAARTERGAPDDDLAVFELVTGTACSACGKDLGKGCLLRVVEGNPRCMSCAGLGHLVILPRGDAALTRRARKHSSVSAVILRWSRARKRYERQGALVEPEALARAEEECRADGERRAEARGKAAVRREVVDARYVAEFAARVRDRYPGCPAVEAATIAGHACEKHSGRVGRSAAAKEFDRDKIDLAVRAHVRHIHTDYDERSRGAPRSRRRWRARR